MHDTNANAQMRNPCSPGAVAEAKFLLQKIVPRVVSDRALAPISAVYFHERAIRLAVEQHTR